VVVREDGATAGAACRECELYFDQMTAKPVERYLSFTRRGPRSNVGGLLPQLLSSRQHMIVPGLDWSLVWTIGSL
jgi:hypothetical protein